MSNTRQFLVPINYDITKPIYHPEDPVRKREYFMHEIKSVKQYQQIYTKTFANEKAEVFADKLRRRAKFH